MVTLPARCNSCVSFVRFFTLDEGRMEFGRQTYCLRQARLDVAIG